MMGLSTFCQSPVSVDSHLKEATKMAKNEKTSPTVATKASKLLSNPKTPANIRSVAASALTQAANKGKKK